MLFTEVIHAIHPHLMKDENAPGYMRNLIQMLCDIPEDEWSTKKDPSSKENCKDNSLSKYHSSGPSKILARKMLGRLSKDNFLSSIYDANRSDVVLEGLVEDIAPFVKTTNIDKVGEDLFDLLKRGLEECINPSLENDRKIQKAQQISAKLKGVYGGGLLEDCGYTCSMPGCSHHLQTLASDGQSTDNYEVLVIDDKKTPDFSNICAVCASCLKKYILKHTAPEKKELIALKNLQVTARKARESLSETNIDKGIMAVVESLASFKLKELGASINYDPVPIKQKIDESEDCIFVDNVKTYVTKYYFQINQLMQDLSRQKKYPDELVRSQIKTIYLTLEGQGLSQVEIFDHLSKKIHRITKQPESYCQVVVCYFIQSCEVFHDITQ